MVESLIKEIVSRVDYINGEEIKTIYLGGGTPSLLRPSDLERIHETIKAEFIIDNAVEFTIEANPDDIDSKLVTNWKNIGVNRISLGVQSFDQKDLDWMNRVHEASQSELAIETLKEANITNISIDLIYGLPEQSIENWREQLQKAIALDVPHLSCYCLTVEPKTALNKWVNTGKITVPEDEIQTLQFKELKRQLEDVGYLHYEISNFAKPGFKSAHNSSYWKGEKYLGIGPSAHSFDGESRQWNIRNNHQYMKAIGLNQLPFEREVLSATDRFNVQVLIGLRVSEGLNLEDLSKICALSNEFHNNLEELKLREWIIEHDGAIMLSKEGQLRADHIASALFIDN